MPGKVFATHHADDLLFNQYTTELLNKLADQQLDNRRILVLHLNLVDKLTYHKIATEVARYKPDHIICFTGPEPNWAFDSQLLLAALGSTPYSFLGYVKHPAATFLDFWALCTDKFFPAYTDQQLAPVESNQFYLCHNRQPYAHRKLLVDALDHSAGFISFGSRSEADRTIDKTLEFYQQEAFHPWHKKLDGTLIEIPYDTYTLGDLTVWQQTVLNIVSDSFWINKPSKFGNLFISEKYYKPILGLRPFLTYGNPETYYAFKDLGFKTFEEDLGLFPADLTTSMEGAIVAISSAVNYLNGIGPSARLAWYNKLMPKLLYNRDRFKQHVKEQQAVLDNYRV